MDPTAIQAILDLIQSGGVIGVFVLLAVAILKEWLVLGREYRREKERADKYEALAWRGTKLNEVQVDMAAGKEGS